MSILGGVVALAVLGIYIFRKTSLRQSDSFKNRMKPKTFSFIDKKPHTPPPAPVPKMEDFVDNMTSSNYVGSTIGTSYTPSTAPYVYDYQDYGFQNPPPDVYQNNQGYQNHNENQYNAQYKPYGAM
jgi:hypothetical protein